MSYKRVKEMNFSDRFIVAYKQHLIDHKPKRRNFNNGFFILREDMFSDKKYIIIYWDKPNIRTRINIWNYRITLHNTLKCIKQTMIEDFMFSYYNNLNNHEFYYFLNKWF